MKADRGLGARLSPRQTHAYGPLKRAVKVLGTRAVDRRTRIGKALDRWRTDLISDLGGPENISTQERALIDEAVLTKLILSSLSAWMLNQQSLVSNKNRGALPVVLHRNQLVTTLKSLLEALGLKRRAREVETLDSIAREYAERGRAMGHSEPSPPEENPQGSQNGGDPAPDPSLEYPEKSPRSDSGDNEPEDTGGNGEG